MDGFSRAASESTVIALINAGNVKGAEMRLRAMLAEDPNDARALALMAHCSLAEDKDSQALETARAAANIDPDDPLVKDVLVSALLANGKHKEADVLTTDLAARDPENGAALFRLAIARFNTKDRVYARELFDAAEKFAGDDVRTLLNLARLRLHEWNYESAAELSRRAMTLDPNRSEAFRVLGECALAAKEPVDAYELSLEALRLSPGDKQVMRLLTRARARQHSVLKPFLKGVDWIVEMDRTGLIVLPILMAVLGFALAVSVNYDLTRMQQGHAPAVIVSVALGLAAIYVLVSYLTAVTARARIWRDLREISLSPKF